MRFAGRVFRTGKYWAVEVPILHVVSQGHSRKDAFEMIADAIECLVNKADFKIQVFHEAGEYFEIGSDDEAALTALLLRRERLKSGLSLPQAAQRMGAKSHNAYARYEQGRAIPTVRKLSQLFSAVAANEDFVITESRVR